MDVTVSSESDMFRSSADRYTYTNSREPMGGMPISSTPSTTPGGREDSTVTITGTNFSGVTGVFFGSVPSASFTFTISGENLFSAEGEGPEDGKDVPPSGSSGVQREDDADDCHIVG